MTDQSLFWCIFLNRSRFRLFVLGDFPFTKKHLELDIEMRNNLQYTQIRKRGSLQEAL